MYVALEEYLYFRFITVTKNQTVNSISIGLNLIFLFYLLKYLISWIVPTGQGRGKGSLAEHKY